MEFLFFCEYFNPVPPINAEYNCYLVVKDMQYNSNLRNISFVIVRETSIEPNLA